MHLDVAGRAVWHRVEHDGARVIVTVKREPGATSAPWTSTLPPADDVVAFDALAAAHPRLRALSARAPGLRLIRMPWLFDVAAGAVLQQRVRFFDAAREFARIAERLGRDTPFGRAFPHAAGLLSASVADLQACGVDVKRARTLWALARTQRLHPFLYNGMSGDLLRRRLEAVPGVGPWTTSMILGFGAGERDALLTGDLHLPRMVREMLDPDAVGPDDDARLLALLAPFAGHRFRVARLVFAARLGKAR